MRRNRVGLVVLDHVPFGLVLIEPRLPHVDEPLVCASGVGRSQMLPVDLHGLGVRPARLGHAGKTRLPVDVMRLEEDARYFTSFGRVRMKPSASQSTSSDVSEDNKVKTIPRGPHTPFPQSLKKYEWEQCGLFETSLEGLFGDRHIVTKDLLEGQNYVVAGSNNFCTFTWMQVAIRFVALNFLRNFYLPLLLCCLTHPPLHLHPHPLFTYLTRPVGRANEADS